MKNEFQLFQQHFVESTTCTEAKVLKLASATHYGVIQCDFAGSEWHVGLMDSYLDANYTIS